MEIFSNHTRLEKDVQIDIHKRPIKIAFFISDEENTKNHLILDEIFRYAYTCWAGTTFLILPLNNDEDKYLKWLNFYDADIVYSYIKLTTDQINKIEETNSPALLIEHNFEVKGEYLPVHIPSYSPIKSISTIHSPYVYNSWRYENKNNQINLITQYHPKNGERFITDNFGNQLEPNQYLNEIKGLFNTYCLATIDIPKNNYVGTEILKSSTEVLEKLSNREAITVARLAKIHSESIEALNYHNFKNTFAIVIGSTVKDRISFWNLRHFHKNNIDSIGSLIITEEQSHDFKFLEALGKYLNNFNIFRSNGSGAYQVSIFSQSLSKENLTTKLENLQKFTHNLVGIPSFFSETVIPTNFNEVDISFNSKDTSSFSVSENHSIISMDGPKHLRYIPLKFQKHGTGDFSTEFSIDRHKNLSIYTNVIDKWILPKKAYIAKIFGEKFLRISKNKLPILITGNFHNFLSRNVEKDEFQTNIFLPEDLQLLNFLLTQKNNYSRIDLRSTLIKSKIEYIDHSDKGKNFNGVVSLFGKLNIASNFLTNGLWKDIFIDASTRNKKEDYLYTLDILKSFQKPYRGNEFKKTIIDQMGFEKTTYASQYLTACFKDALNDLIKYKIFYPVYTWSCKNCGYKNIRTVDSTNLKNICDICENSHTILIDEGFSWEFLLNKFVHKVLFEHSGLPVLWSLNYIQNLSKKNSFLYLPEVNIYYDIKNPNQLNEIDLIGVYDGIFFIGEAKRSADYFLLKDREVDKFMELVENILPDQAFLIFDKYTEDESNIEKTKSNLESFKERFRTKFKNINLKIVMYDDFINMSFPVIDFGVIGKNVCAFLDNLENQ